MPNGIIIAYEVSYKPTASSEPETRVNTTALVTHFTTEDNLEEDTEFFFSVRAYTRVGPGNTSSLTVSTLPKSSNNICMNLHITCSGFFFYQVELTAPFMFLLESLLLYH